MNRFVGLFKDFSEEGLLRKENYSKHTLANKSIEVWNNLPTQYKEPMSYNTFKTIIKKYLL